jgi:hypothetical protein
MAPLPFTLVPVNPNNLMSIDPKNWRRYPSVAITAAMLAPAYVPPILFTTGVANLGADSDNNGEVGTLSVAYNSDAPYADTGAYGPLTQAARAAAANLTPGTIIAPDIGKSYALDGTTRGAIEPFDPYPSVNLDEVPDAFKPASML